MTADRQTTAITSSTSERLRSLARSGDFFAADRERLLFAADAIEDREALRDSLRTLSMDMHNTSERPCPTCDPITKLLGEPFGCRGYEAQIRARENGSTWGGGSAMSDTIRVTVTDPETNNLLDCREMEDDYLIICAGRRYVANTQAYANGTHVITVKVDTSDGSVGDG